MSVRAILVVGLALASGVSAAVGVTKMQPAPAAPIKLETTSVLVAKRDISLGVPVTADDLTTREWPAAQVPEGALTDSKIALGRPAKYRILEGEVLLEKKLATEDEGRGMAPLVRPGMRAFTVLTPTISSGVAGFILPGNHVDVFMTFADTNQTNVELTGGGTTTLLLQNVEVVAVDSKIEAPDSHQADQLKSVTLMVAPREAAMLSMAQQKGTLNLALRNDGDIQQASGAAVTFNDVRWAYGKPFDEPEELDATDAPAEPEKSTLASLAEFATTVLSSMPEPAAKSDSVPAQPVRLRIRTLRGISPGEVHVDLHAAPAASDSVSPRTSS